MEQLMQRIKAIVIVQRGLDEFRTRVAAESYDTVQGTHTLRGSYEEYSRFGQNSEEGRFSITLDSQLKATSISVVPTRRFGINVA